MQTQLGSNGQPAHAHTEAVLTTDIDFTADLADPSSATKHGLPAERPIATAPPRKEPKRPAADSAREPEPRLPVAPGRVLRDRYVLTQIIGIGGMCTVFQARDLEALPGSGKPTFVALKTPRPDYPDAARAIERLKREFEYAQRLSHIGIAQTFELASDGDIWFMTMELLEGESLAAILRRQGAALPPYLIRRVLRGIADPMSYAHACGIAHGDLNPANVFVLAGERVKLIDFAAACGPGERPTGAATLAYASPQVLDGEAPEPRDDLFSFGCIAYEMSMGQHPFARRPSNVVRAEGLRPEPPTKLANEAALALMSALSFDRDARPTDIKSLAKTLAPDPQRVRAPLPEPAFVPPPAQDESDKRWWALAAACVIAMIVAVVATRI
jgi:serine/threonine protein kinase